MKVSDLRFDYPENLIATEPSLQSRILWIDGRFQGQPTEIVKSELLARIPKGSVLVINNTRVEKRRVFASELEILFLTDLGSNRWHVLFPAKRFRVGDSVELPGGRVMTLLEKGRPQLVEIKGNISEEYFEKYAELPLPPYIQKARGSRHNSKNDESWYQTRWAHKAGSLAAPTASLHFNMEDIQLLKARGVEVVEVTLHVGLGTFLPVTSEDLNEHKMHFEFYCIEPFAWEKILQAQREGQKIWAMGTTVVRTLESAARSGELIGSTDLLIQPGFQFQIVDCLMTNFHQPESTLLALVYAFAGQRKVQEAYQFAIKKQFRLFSYGDLSVWLRNSHSETI